MPQDFDFFEKIGEYYLAQFNIARMRTDYSHPIFDDFKSRLHEVHKAASEDVDFVWRFEGEHSPDTYIKPYPEDPLLLGNLSTWRSIDALRSYTFSDPHLQLMKEKRKWFMKMEGHYSVLWWSDTPRPTLKTAKERLEYLQREGVSQLAFTFQKPIYYADFEQITLKNVKVSQDQRAV